MVTHEETKKWQEDGRDHLCGPEEMESVLDFSYPVVEEVETEQESVEVCGEQGEIEDDSACQPQEEGHQGIEEKLAHSKPQKQQN